MQQEQYLQERTVTMVLEKEKQRKRKKLKRKKKASSWKNHQATMALLISLPNTHFEENQEEDEKRKGCMSVPSYKGSWLQDSGRPWYRGYGTIHETRTGYLVATRRSKDSHDCRETPLSWASELIPQSIKEKLQLKGVDVERPQPPGKGDVWIVLTVGE